MRRRPTFTRHWLQSLTGHHQWLTLLSSSADLPSSRSWHDDVDPTRFNHLMLSMVHNKTWRIHMFELKSSRPRRSSNRGFWSWDWTVDFGTFSMWTSTTARGLICCKSCRKMNFLLWKLACHLALLQIKDSRYFSIENPQRSQLWKLPCIIEIEERPAVWKTTLDAGAFGATVHGREVVRKGSGDEGKWWGREVVTMGSGEEGKWWRREVMMKGSGEEGKWWGREVWGREVVTKGSGEEGKWWWSGVVTKGSGEEGKWWRREVMMKGSGEEGNWQPWRGVVHDVARALYWGGSRSGMGQNLKTNINHTWGNKDRLTSYKVGYHRVMVHPQVPGLDHLNNPCAILESVAFT